MEILSTSGGLIAGVVGLLGALISMILSYWQSRKRQRENARQKELIDALDVSLTDSFKNTFIKFDSTLSTRDETELVNNIRNYFAHYPRLEVKTNVDEQVNKILDELKRRIEMIESRFPKEATLEKIASVNDAIMATQLEAMSDSIKTLQNKMLTKWDVAKTVFAVLGALGVIIAIIFGIMNWLKP